MIFSLQDYKLYRSGDPDNVRKGGVCVNYKETLAVQFIHTKLNECIVSEITFKNKKKGPVIPLYRSPLQTPDQFDTFLSHLRNYCKIFLNLRIPLF